MDIEKLKARLFGSTKSNPNERKLNGRERQSDEYSGRRLREMVLLGQPSASGMTPTADFPNVFAVILDTPVGDGQTGTIYANWDGEASLYTTTKFGIIGGGFHETVNSAAKRFVQEANRHFDDATPVTEFPYPGQDQGFFYLVTFQGVRLIGAEMRALTGGKHPYSELFRLGNDVLTQLRLVVDPGS